MPETRSQHDLFQRLNLLTSGSSSRGMFQPLHGIEKEGLRTDPAGRIARTPHPATLGCTLTHPQITTDYSEALLELITPVHGAVPDLMADLDRIHRFVIRNLGDELLWAASMPCRLSGHESVDIARYGDSNLGKLKHLYRVGLAHRYGRIMQSIAGLHFNFSMGEPFWTSWHGHEAPSMPLQAFKTDRYFALIRNFKRHAWLLAYLFGASPVVDRSFLEGLQHPLQPLDPDTFHLPWATCLRMSDLGYQSSAQSMLNICFNQLDTYTDSLEQAIRTPYPDYTNIGLKRGSEYLQINTSILQIENEYYSSIRPKRVTRRGEYPNTALRERGIEYIEVRLLDLNPYLTLGIDDTQVRFLDAFLVWCLLNDSPRISPRECQLIDANLTQVLTEGRRPNLGLTDVEGKVQTLPGRGQALLAQIGEVAAELDTQASDDDQGNAGQPGTGYAAAVDAMAGRVQDPEQTLSAQLLADLRKEQVSFVEWTTEQSRQHCSTLAMKPLSADQLQAMEREARASFAAEKVLRDNDKVPFDVFLENYNRRKP